MLDLSKHIRKISTESDFLVLVDDDLDQVILLEKCFELSERKERLVTFQNGEDFLSKLEKLVKPVPPAAIFLDINMPGLNGFEVLERINSVYFPRDFPVIMLTASGDDEDKKRSEQLKADAFWTKPGSVNKYIEVFKSI